MTIWLRTDVDFGAPYITLVLHGNSRLGMEFQTKWRMDIEDSAGVTLQAIVVEKFIETVRPELKGCIVIGMQLSLTGYVWKFNILHPSLKRVKTFEYVEERLETCPVCKKPLSMNKRWLRSTTNDYYTAETFEVCSEQCVTAEVTTLKHNELTCNEDWKNQSVQIGVDIGGDVEVDLKELAKRYDKIDRERQEMIARAVPEPLKDREDLEIKEGADSEVTVDTPTIKEENDFRTYE